ncbi:MAG TPA: hypothetical protein VKS82_03250 [Streptosporangiaceae bacterium]|nr:hypothetical protein [Streptosporangiaceae bacterium]
MRWRLRGGRGPAGDPDAELDAALFETWQAAAAAVGKMIDLPAGKEALLANSGLGQEDAADLPPRAGLTRQVARRRAVRPTGAVAAALAAGVLVLVAVVVPNARHGATREPTVNAAYVVKRVDHALSAAEPGEIAQMTVTTTLGPVIGGKPAGTRSENWSFGGQWRSVMYSPAGHPAYDEGSGTALPYNLVSYLTRTWARQRGLGHPAEAVPGPRSCRSVITALPQLFQLGLLGAGFAPRSLPVTVAGALRAAVSCKSLTVAGRQRVDGIAAIKLTSPPNASISETIWVSPGTYLPVRVVVRAAPGQPVVLTAEISWLPPTAQNLAMLTVPIPAGFRQVPLARAVTSILQRFPQPNAVAGHPPG